MVGGPNCPHYSGVSHNVDPVLYNDLQKLAWIPGQARASRGEGI